MKDMKQTLCMHCGKPATVFYRETINGKTTEKYLCAACAGKEGLGGQPSAGWLHGFFDDDLFSPFPLFSGLFAAPAAEKGARCPRCGKTVREIKEDGKFGCSQCYESFGKALDLKPFIGSGYRGEALTAAPNAKSEAKAEPKKEEKNEDKIARLKAELKKALAAEEYEKAAALRDEIRALEGK